MDLWTYSTAIIWLASLYDDTRNTSLHTFDYLIIKMGEHNLQQWYIHIFPQQKILILPLFSSRIIYEHKVEHKGN